MSASDTTGGSTRSLGPRSSGRAEPARRRTWVLRIGLVVFLGIAVVVIWISNIWLTDRFTESTRNRSELRLALYSGSVMSELQRHSVVPLLLSRDPVMIRSLEQNDFSTTSQRLISYVEEIGAASLILLNREGRVVAATDRLRISELRSSDPFFVEALRSADTVFTTNEPETGRFDFTFSRRIEVENNLLGVILVEVDLGRIVDRWRGTTEAVFLTNDAGEIILSTEPRWRGRTEGEALELEPAPSAIERAIEATGNWAFGDQNALFFGAETIRLEARIPFRGWRIVSHTAYASVRERVNGVLALQIMGFALFLAGGFYVLSRRARLQSAMFQRESAELRRLNARLQREIAERQKAERNLEEAEQSLAQSQKLAALGEMSAAVSHELNQPLAAMKTYLAGARLLLDRRRVAEAGSSFQRIDDLIDRMSAITRQLKSYARKGGDAFEPVDLRDALKGAITIMEPQLRAMMVEITQNLPRRPVMVLADRLRLEQVIINLLRNALDAMKDNERREIDVLIAEGDEAVLSVRDIGTGSRTSRPCSSPSTPPRSPARAWGWGLPFHRGSCPTSGGA
jgi:two-component system C4-dicarboxylate transport sensor histidine kinase DctB